MYRGVYGHVEARSVAGRDLKMALEGDTLQIDHPQLVRDLIRSLPHV